MLPLFYQENVLNDIQTLKHLTQMTINLSINLYGYNSKFNNKFFKSDFFKHSLIEHSSQEGFFYLYDEKGLWLARLIDSQILKIQTNWLACQKRVVNAGKKNELLLKATKITPDTHVIDATAGLGHDSILMAGRGAKVIMLEEQPYIHALLADGIHQIRDNKNWQNIHQRLSLVNTNAVDFCKKIFENKLTTNLTKTSEDYQSIDLIYLDPMFPHESYKSALVNKNMQLLQKIAQPPSLDDEIALLESALKVAKRVIVKRPHDAPKFANTAPENQWIGDVIRYDEYRM